MEWNNHPFEKDTPVRTFGSGSELATWDAENCDRCIKHEECELCDAITAAYLGDGRIPLWVAKQIGCQYSARPAESAGQRSNEISHFDPKKEMKSERAKEFIDGCMSHLEVDMSEHAKWQLRTAMANVAELAEEDARVRAGIALCKAVCGGRNGCTDLGCKMLPSYLKHYDNE